MKKIINEGKLLRKASFAFLFVAVFSMFLSGCTTTQVSDADQKYALTILHTNDVHSNYGGFTSANRICYAPYCVDGKGGSVRLQQAVQAIKKEIPNTIILDAGDEFQGTLYWTTHKEAVSVDILNAIGYQAFIPGNHEFDDGCEPFLKLVRALKTPVLAANLSFSKPLSGSERIRPWTIINQNGRKVGIIGLANAETANLSSPCVEVQFTNEAEALRKATTQLTAQGVDIIIALTHVGLENDRRLARSVAGVDILVGGHSHSLLSNKLPNAVGVYPIVEKSPEGKPVLVVSAANASMYLGRLNVTFDAQGVPINWNGEPVPLDDAMLTKMKVPPPDVELVNKIETYSKPVQQMMQTPLGEISVAGREGKPLEESSVLQCREGDCLTGNIVTDALLKTVTRDAQVVLLNAGTLRYSLPGGKVTTGDVLATLPFQNTPMMTDMSGNVLWQALERGVSTYGEGEGCFLQTAGLRYVFDPRKPAGKRIVNAEVRNPMGKWQSVQKDVNYRVVTIDFLANGGDGFSMFPALKWKEAEMLMNDALRIYLEKNLPLSPKLEGRIKKLQ
jgi:5'-nucleotidase